MITFAIVPNNQERYPVALETPLERFPLSLEELDTLLATGWAAKCDLDPNFEKEMTQ